MHTFRSIKGMCEEKGAWDGSYLADLCPMHGVASCHWLVGITLPKNKVHTFFSKSWACGSPSLMPRPAERVNIVDMWARSPLTVSGVLHSLNGEKAEVPSPPCIIPSMSSEWTLQFYMWYKL
jgi:hypothetical protein